MAMIDRIKGILLTPKEEWPKIAAEPATVQSLYTNWIVILSALPAIAGLIAFLGRGFGAGIAIAVVSYFVGLVIVYVVALIADALATSFGGEKDFVSALKLVAYSLTAGWIGGIAQIIPVLGMLIGLAASLYGIYLFYLGAPVLRKCSPDKAVGYTIVVALCVLLLQFVVAGILISGMMGTMMGAGVGMR